ncbi:MAG: universal stress protein [Mycobacteriaceae bacterium]
MSVNPVVVGVDGSEQSCHAVRWGAREAQLRRQPLRLIATHPGVADDSGFFAGRPDVLTDHRERAATALAQAHTLATAALTDSTAGVAAVRVEDELVEGMPVPTLLRAAESATVLVVGSRGLSAFSAELIGSVTYAMVGHAECPVAVIPHGAWSQELHANGSVVVGVDGSPASELAVTMAFTEADLRGVELVAVHAYSDLALLDPDLADRPAGVSPDDSVDGPGQGHVLAERLAGWQERYPGVTVRRVTVRDRPVRTLLEWSETAQLVVVGSRGRGGFASMILGSTSRALLHTTSCPLLVVRSSR